MSQLTALFALLHNNLIDLVRRHEPAAGANAHFGAAYKRFLCVRAAVTSIYHNILRKDLMRRLLHPAIYAAYSVPNPDFIDRSRPGSDAGWQIPIEFSHGAFRFGHAMVRPEYQINDLSTHDLNNTLEKSSANDPVNMPLDSSWIVRWSRFFEIDGSRPNFSDASAPISAMDWATIRFFLPSTNQSRRPAVSRPVRRRDRRNVVGGCVDCGNRTPPAALHQHVAAAVRPRLARQSNSRLAGFRAGLWRPHDRRHRNSFQRSAVAVLYFV